VPRTVTEVLIGTGTLYIAPVGTAFPADPTVAPGGSFIDIGYSEEGWTFVLDRTIESVMAAEEFDPLKVLQTARETHVRGATLQASLENIKIAMGGGTITTPGTYDKYTPPAGGAALTAFAVLFRVLGVGTAKMRDFLFPNCVSVAAVEVPHNKAPNVSLLAIDLWATVPAAGNIFEINETN